MVASPDPIALREWQTHGCSAHCRRVRAVPLGATNPLWLEIHDADAHDQASRYAGLADGYGRGYEAGQTRLSASTGARLHAEGWAEGWATGTLAALMAVRPFLRSSVTAVRTGPLVVSLDDELVTVRGEPVHLTPNEWLILSTVAARGGALIWHTTLVDVLWPSGLRGNHVVALPLNALRVHVDRLRAKLGPARPLFRTVAHRGYLLEMVPPEEVPS
jgi:DNA-binding winged helix-turn-helix (wHTH) protein